jgi:hypothetical protein
MKKTSRKNLEKRKKRNRRKKTEKLEERTENRKKKRTAIVDLLQSNEIHHQKYPNNQHVFHDIY